MAAFVWTQRPDGTGSIRIGADTVTTPTRVVHVSSDSLVIDVTQPVSTGQPGASMATLRLTSYVCGDALTGTGQATLANGRINRTVLRATRSR
jgi:hypothetical protein